MTAIDHIIINDGQYRYPVLRSDVEASAQRHTDGDIEGLRMMLANNTGETGADTYSLWCTQTPMDDSRGVVGTQGCIDYCNELVEAGAPVWDLV